MTFNSTEYFLFLGLVASLFWASAPKLRQPLLLVASYAFYASWSWRYVPLLLLTTTGSYFAALAIPGASPRRQRWLVRITVGLTTALVVGYKTAEVLAGGFSLGGGLDAAATTRVSDLLIPIGLSFYSFQVISYVVDVKRGVAEPCRSFVTYAVFVSFFPHILAGPIVRAARLIPQFDNRRKRPNPIVLREGLHLLLLGLFKKVVLGDALMASVRPWMSTGIFEDPRLGTPMILTGQATVLLANYFDISGYTDLARGSAKLFGVRMPQVFAQPFTRSRNWTEFWRRWQIPIMGFFRDYVYRPVRERVKASAWSDTIALYATFLAAGVWHGLNPGWILWGTMTATLLALERYVKTRRQRHRGSASKRRRRNPIRSAAYVYGCLMLTTPFAGAPSLEALGQLYRRLLTAGLGTADWNMTAFCGIGIACLLLSDAHDRHLMTAEGFADPVTTRRAVAVGAMLVGIIVFSGPVGEQFVYFRF